MRFTARPTPILTNYSLHHLLHRAGGMTPSAIRPIAEGAFGMIYEIQLGENTGPLIVKLFKHPGCGQREQAYLTKLQSVMHPFAVIPSVLYYEPFDFDHGREEALVMDTMPGIDARQLLTTRPLDSDDCITFRERMLAPLRHMHAIHNPAGFGPLGGPYYAIWWEYYQQGLLAINAFLHSSITIKEQIILPRVIAVAERALECGPRIFANHHPQPSLLHGDYCLGNVLVDPTSLHITGVIDPLQVDWGDLELDIVNLTKGHGDHYRLYDCYLAQYRTEGIIDPQDPYIRLRFLYYMFWMWLSYYATIALDDRGWYSCCAEWLDTELTSAGF